MSEMTTNPEAPWRTEPIIESRRVNGTLDRLERIRVWLDHVSLPGGVTNPMLTHLMIDVGEIHKALTPSKEPGLADYAGWDITPLYLVAAHPVERITYTEVCTRGLSEEALAILTEHLAGSDSTSAPKETSEARAWEWKSTMDSPEARATITRHHPREAGYGTGRKNSPALAFCYALVRAPSVATPEPAEPREETKNG